MFDRIRNDELVRGRSGRLFLTVSLGALLVQNGRVVLSPLLPTIISELGITSSQAGVALSIMWAFSALLQYFGGQLADRLSRKTVLVGATGCLVLGFLSLLSTTSYLTFVLGVIVAGIGMGLYNAAAYAQVADLYDESRGKAFGVLSAAMDFGAALAAALATVVLAVAVWQFAFAPLCAVLLVVLLGIHRLSDEPYVVATPRLDLRDTLGRLFGQARIRLALLALALFSFIWQGVTSFLPTYLQVERGLSPAFANAAFTLLFIVGIVARPLAGGLGDRLGHVTVATFIPVGTAVGLGLILVAPSYPVVVAGVLLLGAGMSAFFPVLQTYVMNLFPDASMAGDFGATRTVFITLGSLGPAYVGVSAAHVGYGGSFATLLAGLGLIFALMLAIRRVDSAA